MPYFEQGNVFRSVDVATYMSNGDQAWRKIRSVSIPLFVCPSDSGQEVGFNLPDKVTTQQDLEINGTWARGNSAANAGPGFFHFTQRGLSSKPNLGGVMGINWGVSLGELTQQDGTSNTILFNEVRVGIEARDRRGIWAMGLVGSSVTAANATVGDCPMPNDREPLSDDVEDCQLFWSPQSAPATGWAAPIRTHRTTGPIGRPRPAAGILVESTPALPTAASASSGIPSPAASGS